MTQFKAMHLKISLNAYFLVTSEICMMHPWPDLHAKEALTQTSKGALLIEIRISIKQKSCDKRRSPKRSASAVP